MLYFWAIPLFLLLLIVVVLSFKNRSRKVPAGESRLDEARKR
jgi:cytochrome c-type biogenesis protein CcmH/NrfF